MILGHERLREVLWRGLREARPHHAYLFEGAHGLGKRAVADAFAAAANCLTVPPGEGEACGTCGPCREIARGIHPDVIALVPDEDRAARTIPVERVREVIRQLTYHRFSARRRFVIVDPAEAMQEAAANAILKTLEEPPEGTHFLLITHNPAALLPTIRSRCQRVRFGSLPIEVVRDWLIGRGRSAETADGAARAALGAPGIALQLDEAALEGRRTRRLELTRVLEAGGDAPGELAARLTQGARQEWTPGVEAFLETVEEVVRDAIVAATGADVAPAGDTLPLVHALARTWPDGTARCVQAIQEARDDLEVYVSGKTVLDALLAGLRRELRAAGP